MKAATLVLLLSAATLAGVEAQAQDLGAADAPRKVKQYVAYSAEAQVVAAGKPAMLELHFHVNDGYHVNSHKPKSELLLPTVVEFQPADGVKGSQAEYPAGRPYSFPIDPTEKLDVYQDDFVVRVPVVASAGPHELKGMLKYQACDNAACYPPKVLPISVLFTAK